MLLLFYSLRNLQAGRMELTQGVKMLFAVFAIFTFCYITRTIYDFLVKPTIDFPNIFLRCSAASPLGWPSHILDVSVSLLELAGATSHIEKAKRNDANIQPARQFIAVS